MTDATFDNIKNQGNRMREKAVAVAMKRKEEYLGARVPKELRDKVIQRAKSQGIPVSILIRNILTEAFQGAGAPMGELLGTVAKADSSEASFADVLGWENITLNRAHSCAGCGTALQEGQKVSFGVGARQPVVLCGECKE